MPRLKSDPLAALSPIKAALLFDRQVPAGGRYILAMDADPGVDPEKELWDEHKTEVLDAWVMERPGTRPSLWWKFDAPRWNAPKEGRDWCYVKQELLPERRLRLGGVGVPAFEVLADAPCWPFGIPVGWETLDADNPPLYEAQAEYLRSHGLLLPGELERLTDADFEPEVVDEEPQEILAFCKKHGI